jgi:hypothetical protein
MTRAGLILICVGTIAGIAGLKIIGPILDTLGTFLLLAYGIMKAEEID